MEEEEEDAETPTETADWRERLGCFRNETAGTMSPPTSPLTTACSIETCLDTNIWSF